MTQISRIPVDHSTLFPAGVFVLAVIPVRDFEASKPGSEVQARDKDTGELMWLVEALNGDPDARGDRTVKVKIAAPVQPVPPVALPGTPFRPVEFEGLTVTAWVDSQRCVPGRPGEGHRCRAKQGVSLNATGMRPPAVVKSRGLDESKVA
jgi:hypothetical protein